MRVIVTLVTAALLAGCTVGSRQAESIAGMFKKPVDEFAPYRWRATVGEKQTELLAITVPDGTLFADTNDQSAAFNGWHFTEISGSLLAQPTNLVISIAEVDGERRFSMAGRVVATHECAAWKQFSADAKQHYMQECVSTRSGNTYQNRIDLDSAGNILRIRQLIDLGGASGNNALPELVLEKVEK